MARLSALVMSLIISGWCCGSAAWAQRSAPERTESQPDPSGTWKWQYDFGDTPMDAKLTLNWDGKKLTGKYTAREATSEIHDGKLEKDDVSFVTTREFNGNEFDVEFQGKVERDEIVGTVTIDFGGEPQEFDWEAKRAVEIDDVLGVWDLRIESPNGVVEPQLTITRGSNNTLKGSYSSVFGEREPKELKLKDNEISWEISANDDDQFDFQVLYKGKPRGNAIEGTTEFDFDGNTGTMEFTGKRTPPKDEDQKEPAAEDKPAAEPTPAEPAEQADATTEPTDEAEPAEASTTGE